MGWHLGLKKKVLLGSLNFTNSKTKMWLPYSVGCLISYAKKNVEINERYEFMDPLYNAKDPKHYRTILLQADILGLTCFAWNQGYNDRLAVYYKKLRPDGIVIYGGPQVPEDKKARNKWLHDRRKFLDHCIEGQAEISFTEWLLDKPRSYTVLKEVPTPYKDGIFDNIIINTQDTKFGATIESDRGCPYSCAFCDWGGNTRSKLIPFDYDTVMSEIDWSYSKPEISEVFLANANFGILKRDVDIMRGVADLQKKHNRLDEVQFVYGGLAKNGSKNLKPIMDILLNEINITQHNMKVSFQTHTPEVLKLIKRDNISNEKLMPLVKNWQSMGKKVAAEMIIGLPGETADSWLKSLDHMVHDLGVDRAATFILQITRNTLLDDEEFQQQHKIKTKRIWYGEQYSQTIINECFSFDLEEIVRMYDHHWVFNNFVNTGILPVSNIISLYDQTKLFLNKLDEMPLMKELVERHRQMTRKVFRPDNTYLEDSREITWFTTTMRFDDLQIMESNKEQSLKELSVVFDVPDSVQFKIVDSGYRKIPEVV